MAEEKDHYLADRAATLAGELLLSLSEEAALTGFPSKQLGNLADRRSHELLTSLLKEAFPEDSILSEEDPDSYKRLAAERIWILDPLDGTREFSEGGRDDWAVHVALVEQEVPTVGVVALPAMRKTFTNYTMTTLPEFDGPVRIVDSRTRPGPVAELLAEELSGELIRMGSAGAKAMEVVQGNAEVYAHSGGQYEWDSCAPVAVALASGLHASRLDGSPLLYNQRDTYLPDLLICRKELAETILSILN